VPREPFPSKRARKLSPVEGRSIFTCDQPIKLTVTVLLDMVSRDADIIDLISDDDGVPQAATANKGKGKAPEPGDIIELSD
jgi:hypothetical protein